MTHARAAVLLLLATVVADASALDFDTSVRGSAWSRSQDLTGDRGIVSTQLWARMADSETLGGVGFKFYGEGWFSRVDGGGGDEFDQRLREAYGQLSYGPLELRAGWQMFPWGRADGINPTDNLTPRQLTLLTRDLDDQRFGTPSVRATWYAGPVSTDIIWLAGFRPSVTPWLATAPPRVDAPPASQADQWAARLDWVEGEIEGSLSYFDGYDVLPTAASLAAEGPPEVVVRHDRIRVAGADFAKTVDRVILRGEFAHTATPDSMPGDVFSLRSQWLGVFGAEETFGDYLDLEIQWYYRRVYGKPEAAGLNPQSRPLADALAVTAQQYDPIDRGFTIRVADKWLNETVEASLSGVFSVVRHGYLLRPLIDYRATDDWTLSLGADIPAGGGKTLYGLLRDDRAVYFELRRGF